MQNFDQLTPLKMTAINQDDDSSLISTVKDNIPDVNKSGVTIEDFSVFESMKKNSESGISPVKICSKLITCTAVETENISRIKKWMKKIWSLLIPMKSLLTVVSYPLKELHKMKKLSSNKIEEDFLFETDADSESKQLMPSA